MTETSLRPGRPRDPDVDRRVAQAAVAQFGEAGWQGFSVEAVARRAGVGKASIYLRWPTKSELLLDALKSSLGRIEDIARDTVRDDLLELTRHLMASYQGDVGAAFLRMTVEARQIPGVAEHWESLKQQQILAARAIVRRAIARGELPEGTSVTLLLDTLCGAASMHAQAAPAALRPAQQARAEEYAASLVDYVLAAASAAPRTRETHTSD